MGIIFSGKKSKDSLRATQERKRSGASGTHDSRPNRERSRGDAKRKAIKKSSY